MAHILDLLTSFNYHQWKEDMEIHLCSRGLYQVIMNTELEPNAVAEKIKYWNKLDEAYGFLCFSISKDFIFHSFIHIIDCRFLQVLHYIRYNSSMDSSLDPITSLNYHQWKEDMDIQLHLRGIYRVTMNTELEPNAVAKKVKY